MGGDDTLDTPRSLRERRKTIDYNEDVLFSQRRNVSFLEDSKRYEKDLKWKVLSMNEGEGGTGLRLSLRLQKKSKEEEDDAYTNASEEDEDGNSEEEEGSSSSSEDDNSDDDEGGMPSGKKRPRLMEMERMETDADFDTAQMTPGVLKHLSAKKSTFLYIS